MKNELQSMLLPFCVALVLFVQSGDTETASIMRKVNIQKPLIVPGEINFKALIEKNSVIVDKTLFIKDFIENESKVLFLTYPRKWGKTIAMDMIKTFLEIEVDLFGNRTDRIFHSKRYRIFKTGETSGGHISLPLISKEQDFVNRYMGNWPVIYISLKNVTHNVTSFQDVITTMKGLVSKLYFQHMFLRSVLTREQTKPLNAEYKRVVAKVQLYMFDKTLRRESTETNLKNSLKFLSRLLHDYFGRRVYIFIDDYDTPLSNILKNRGFSPEDFHSTLRFLDGLLSTTFNGNEFLEKGFVTGVRSVIQLGIWHSFQNFDSHNFIQNKFAKYFGFTQDEVSLIFEQFQTPEQTRGQAQAFYDGYRLSTDMNVHYYNSWSVMNFLRDGVLQSYWADDDDNLIIDHFLKDNGIRNNLISMMNKSADRHIPSEFTFIDTDYLSLRKTLFEEAPIRNDDRSFFFKFILTAGYLTLAQKKGSSVFEKVKVPNKEVATEFHRRISKLGV